MHELTTIRFRNIVARRPCRVVCGGGRHGVLAEMAAVARMRGTVSATRMSLVGGYRSM